MTAQVEANTNWTPTRRDSVLLKVFAVFPFTILFGRWSGAAIGAFAYHRIYWRGRWTPLVRVSSRYTT